MVMAPSASAHAVACPALHSWPTDGNEQHDQREGDSHTRDIQYVAKGVVRLWRPKPLGFLSERYEHHASGAIPRPTCLRKPVQSMRVIVRALRRSSSNRCDVAHKMLVSRRHLRM